MLKFVYHQKNYVFKFKPGFSLLCLFFFSLFCVLGVWQVHRYHFKQTLELTFQKRLHEAPEPLSKIAGPLENLQFQSVTTEGRYVNEQTLFMQNQFYNDQLGYEVLTPLRIPRDNKLLLIDRGWIPKPISNKLPNIEKITTTQHIMGYIKLLNEYHFILGKNILNPKNFPLIIQKIDLEQIGQLTQQSFYPYILRLSPKAENGFTRDWVISTSLPQRHMAYAVQWFTMAIVLFIAYLIFCCERIEKENDNYAK